MEIKRQIKLLEYIRSLFRKQNKKTYTPGNVRLGLGMYRTPQEVEKFKENVRKRRLP